MNGDFGQADEPLFRVLLEKLVGFVRPLRFLLTVLLVGLAQLHISVIAAEC